MEVFLALQIGDVVTRLSHHAVGTRLSRTSKAVKLLDCNLAMFEYVCADTRPSGCRRRWANWPGAVLLAVSVWYALQQPQ